MEWCGLYGPTELFYLNPSSSSSRSRLDCSISRPVWSLDLSGDISHAQNAWDTFPRKTVLSLHVVHDGISRLGPSLLDASQTGVRDTSHDMGPLQMAAKTGTLPIDFPPSLGLPVHTARPIRCATCMFEED